MSQWAIADWAKMLEHKLRKLLVGQYLSRFGVGGARGVTSRSTKESHQWSQSERWGRRPTGRGRPDSWDVNISFLLGQPQSRGNAKKKGLDGILDNPAVQWTQMGPAKWSDVSVWFIRAVNFVLDRLDFKEQIVKMILKAKNTFKHKNQSNTINDTVRTIKAIQPAIWSERSKRSKQCNQQYGQSDIIKAIWSATRSRQTRK